MERYYKIPNLIYIIKNDWLDWRIPFSNKLIILFKLSNGVLGWINMILILICLVIPIYLLGMTRDDILFVLGLFLTNILAVTFINILVNIYHYKRNKEKWLMENVCLFNQYE